MSLLGSIAGRMSSNIDKNTEVEREMRKQRMLMELQKEYQDEIIDPNQTRLEGNFEVHYNSRGKEISRRELSAEELEIRRAEIDKKKADSRKSNADAGISEFTLEKSPEIFAREGAESDARIFSARASGSAALSNAATNRRQAEETMGNALYERISTARSLIYSVGGSNDTSMQSQAEEFDAALEGAVATKDKDEVRRITDIIIGSLRLPAMKAEAEAKREPSPWDMIPRTGGLDNAAPTVTVPLRPGER